MKLTRLSDFGDNNHRGKAYIAISCPSEQQLDKVVAMLNDKGWKDEWSTVYEEGDYDTMETFYLVDSTGGKLSDLTAFKADWKEIKKACK